MKSQDENNAHEKDGTKLVVVSVKVTFTLSSSLLLIVIIESSFSK
jgi:hypothetical protein